MPELTDARLLVEVQAACASLEEALCTARERIVKLKKWRAEEARAFIASNDDMPERLQRALARIAELERENARTKGEEVRQIAPFSLKPPRPEKVWFRSISARSRL